MNEDLQDLHAGLNARTYPMSDGYPDDISARYVVDLFGLTIDVRRTKSGTVVDLNPDEMPDEHQPIEVNVADFATFRTVDVSPEQVARMLAKCGSGKDVAMRFVSALDTDVREHLTRAVEEVNAEILDEQIIDAVTERLVELGLRDKVTAVVFTTNEWDDGYFLDGDKADVFLTDGSTQTHNFGVAGEPLAEYGPVGPGFTLAVSYAEPSVGIVTDDSVFAVKSTLGLPTD